MPADHIGKNIVLCCDGTGAEYGGNTPNSNIIRLFERLTADGSEQISFYNPGLGTHSLIQGFIRPWLDRHIAMASGWGIRADVVEAYKFLMAHYEPQDRIYLFGYSRGAHTVLELASLLHACGLLTKGSTNLIPYAMKFWKKKNQGESEGFKLTFARSCVPHFVGLFDAVASVGLFGWRRYYRNRPLSGNIPYRYHALSIDEQRRHFRASIWNALEDPQGTGVIEQTWFPGCHGEIGGQTFNRGISNIPLRWMLQRAESAGMILNANWWKDLARDPAGDFDQSRKHIWRLVPAQVRNIPKGANLHASVIQRKKVRDDYDPPNLPCRFTIIEG